MNLRETARGLFALERNIELCLLAFAVLFMLVAWTALEKSEAGLPGSSSPIVAQFIVTILAGHVGVRLLAPWASPLVPAVAALLAAIGLVFTARLAPDVAADQANWVTIGVALMCAGVVVGRRSQELRRLTYTAAAAAIGLLLITGVFGETVNGARLWLRVGGQLIQTTELIKVLLVVFLAGYLAEGAAVLASPRLRLGGRTYSALPYLIPLALAMGIAIATLALLRDLGSIALLLLLSVGTLSVATGRIRFAVGGAVLLAVTAALGYVAFDHAQRRIDVWVDPFADEAGDGFQTVQALYAIQAGGVTGQGLGMGEPDRIPAAATDYVFSAIAEELGLAGALGVVLLYLVFVSAGLKVAVEARDGHARLLATAIALLIGIQAAVIIAGNLRLIPTTGITLPFVSYGGSSLIVNYFLAGVLVGVSQMSRERR